MKWKILSSKYVIKLPPWNVVKEERVQLPNGNIIDPYYVFEYPTWVCVIGITKEQKFVMVEQYRHALGKTILEICAGITEPEDTNYLESAKREFLEETGYGGGKWEEWIVSSPNPGNQNNLSICYLAKDVEYIQGQSLDKTEEIKVHLMTKEEVREKLENNEILQALHQAALWKWFAND